MKPEELQRLLQLEGFDSRFYSLDGTSPSMQGYVLREHGHRWRVDFFERGSYNNLADFESQWDACDYMYARMKRDFGK